MGNARGGAGVAALVHVAAMWGIVACSSNDSSPPLAGSERQGTGGTGSASQGPFGLPSNYDASVVDIAKSSTVPNYDQLNAAFGGFPNGGADYCCPTAISNGIMWLASNGFPNLAADAPSSEQSQYDLILSLASPSYMNTDPDAGTSPNQACEGMKKWILNAGYSYTRIAYEGWRQTDPEFDGGTTHPTLEEIQNGIQGMSNVWLEIGWYSYDATTDTYTRTEGHDVEVVGYGTNGNGYDPNALVLHDPETGRANDFADLTLITSGTMVGVAIDTPLRAAGYFRLTGTDYYEQHGAILDGIMILEMPASGP